ncbi:hypothetical protein BH24ACT5_BH24ACT5_20090 [soil metagenome]
MHRPVIALAAVLVSIGTGSTVTATSSADGDAETAFITWAAANSTTVERAACSLDGSVVTCYGLWADTPSNPNWSGVLVGQSTDGGATFLAIEVPTPTAEELATSPDPAAVGATSFGDGTWLVGVDVAAGTYRTQVTAGGFCAWKRLSGFGGDLDDVISIEVIDSEGPQIVEILPTDAGFSSDGCGIWTLIG